MNWNYYPSFVLMSFFCVLLIISSTKGRCQDKIYLQNEEIYGKIIEITPEKIKYKRLDNFDGPVYSMTRSKVKLLFNETGSFLVIQKLDSMDTGQADKLINNFLNLSSKKTSNLDKLFTIQSKQINCTILGEDDLLYSINYNDLDIKYDKTLVALIIYKDGKHKLVSDLNTAIEVLGNIQSEINAKTVISKVKGTSASATNINSIQNSSNKPATNVSKTGNADTTMQPLKPSINNEEETNEEKILRIDSLAELKNINKKYQMAIANAQAFYIKEDYENAKSAYSIAAVLKPDEKEPKEKIDSINKILIYDSLVDYAGNLIAGGDYDTALIIYSKILELKPNDYYANQQIKYLKEAMAKKEAEEEIRKKTELEERYRNAIKKGNAFKKTGDYKSALEAFNEAASIHPENEYVKQNIDNLIYQLKIKTPKQ